MVGRLNPNWIVPTAPRGTSDNRAASTAFVTGGSGGAGPRIVLNSATTFYIADNGNDANDGLASTRPWLTPAHASSVLFGNTYDFGGQAVTLQAVAGHAAFTSGLHLFPWVGGGSFAYDGGGGSISATNDNAIDNLNGALPGQATITNVALSATGSGVFNGRCIFLFSAGVVNIGSGVSFGSAGKFQIQAANASVIFINADYSITGSAFGHWAATTSGIIQTNGSRTITLSGTPNFTNAFCFANTAATVLAGGNAFVGAATGSRFNVSQAASIIVNGAGLNYFPGSVAGTITAPGTYN